MAKTLKNYEYYRTDLGVLYCGDCLEILPLITGPVDLVLTDPPYGINYLSPRTDNHDKLKNDELGDWLKCLPLWFTQFKRILTNTGCCCCCCGGGGGKIPVTAMFTMEAIKYFNLIQTLVWKKTIGLGWRYRPSYENIVILSKDKNNYNFYDISKKCSNVINGIGQDIPSNEDHPTQKPSELMEYMLKIHSKQGDLVLEPFCGGGSTAYACERLGRKWIGIEISEKYCKIAAKRIKTEANQLKLFK